MQTDAMLCDYVQPDGNGKLTVVGGGAVMFLTAALELPFELRLGVACTVHIPLSEAASPHHIAIHVEDGDARRVPMWVTPDPDPVPVVTGTLRVPPPPADAGPDAVHVDPFCVMLHLQLEKAGLYEVVVAVDSKEQRRLPFMAGLIPMPGQL